MERRFICGMDEAGRGSVLGPLVIGIVACTHTELAALKKVGVIDSKKLTKTKRANLFKKILDNVSIAGRLLISASEIDKLMKSSVNLNEIEVRGFKRLLSLYSRNISTVYLDAVDVNPTRFGSRIQSIDKEMLVISEHKADVKYTVVAAASIIAKHVRDKTVSKFRKEYLGKYPDLASFQTGYMNDSTQFLREYYNLYQKFPKIARTEWKTCKRITKDYSFYQNSLNTYY